MIKQKEEWVFVRIKKSTRMKLRAIKNEMNLKSLNDAIEHLLKRKDI